MNIVSYIHEEFKKEALNSPFLLNDLANMEKYISESYSGRSLIELLQNADDANAKRFLIKQIDNNIFAIANDGREFNESDLVSLCRSGASTKKRHTNSIGYRGIGFKSIVNYAQNVHLCSGNIQVTFSRERTIAELNNNIVPLIRIPHNFIETKYNKIIDNLKSLNYNTIFIFETYNNCLIDEIKSFDSSCMIFLRNVSEIIFEYENQNNIYITNHTRINDICDKIDFLGTDNSWLIFSKNKTDNTKIAFKYNGNNIIIPDLQECVIHSFMPTNNKINIPLKINSDFSTDPSRTKIVNDEDTSKAIDEITILLSFLVDNIISKKEDTYGMLKILSQLKLEPLRNIKGNSISDIIIEKFIQNQKKSFYDILNVQTIYYQPKGISDSDFVKICESEKVYGISNKDENKINGIVEFAKVIGIPELPIKVILSAMQKIICEFNSRINIFYNIIEVTRFGVDEEILNLVKNSNLLTLKSGIKTIVEINNDDKLDENFEGAILEKFNSLQNLECFFKRMNIPLSILNKHESNNIILDNNTLSNTVNNSTNISTKFTTNSRNYPNQEFGNKSIVKKWRTAEENVVAILQTLNNVNNVIDVADKNLGYDIEVIMNDSSHYYYEVKSVNCMGESFTMTNNEFSSAVQLNEKYFLAIVQQDNEKIKICFINNPIKTLQLSKRVTRWEWYCNSYEGNIVETKI